MRSRVSVIVVSLAVAAGLLVGPAAPAQAATGDAGTVFSLTNTQRTNAGLKPLISDAALDEAAQAWAQQLANSCTFNHSTTAWRAGRVASAGWAATGENIAAGQTTPSAVVTAWMASSGHRANILNKSYTGMGVGFAQGTCYKTYWVQIFGWSKSAAAPGSGDVNGDFDADVLALTMSGDLVAYRGNGTGGWDGSTVVDTGWDTTDRLVTLGDFTGDGISDIGRIRSDGALELLKGTGAGTYADPVRIGTGWAKFTAVIGGIDFNGDGRTDVLARTSTGALMLYRGNGRGSWITGYPQVGSGWNVMNAIIYAGDFNGDNHGDIIARRTDGTLWLYPTNGASGWGAPRQIGNGWNIFTAIFSPGDFNGSGKPDVLVRTSTGTLLIYPGTGIGGWQSKYQVGSGWSDMLQVG